MDKSISVKELEDSLFFWYYYLCWFQGYDIDNELNMDEALEVLQIDELAFANWKQQFFPASINNEILRSVQGELTEELSFHIQFRTHEIVFFLNDTYIGNLGGHFEAWFFTLDELKSFACFPLLFMLFLPMLGITTEQKQETHALIMQHLPALPALSDHATYIANCITNGLIMANGFIKQERVGQINTQNHSVRNINQYPTHTENIMTINKLLAKFVQKKRHE
ncbi:hypothetical protein D7322_13040 [Sphingobacterium puteale]|uniref:Immunity protein 19 n=1 Tax=Sphingobacterium puteale TaxID=2420510 RepID=A0A420VXI5_9SPHI|nr:Imm19 family immunity protein [Sphingobacterium puteale]RKO71080.1 hypothetical protein D7322_13040 [Sphingobacterium puteale]